MIIPFNNVDRAKRNYFYLYLSKLLFVILTIIAIAVALQHYYIISDPKTRFTLWWHIPFNLFYWWCWLLFLPVMYYVAQKLKPDDSKSFYWVVVYLFVPIIIVLIHQAIASLVIATFLNYLNFPTLLYKRLLRNSWVWVDFVIYFTIMIAINVVDYQQKSKINRLKYSQLQARLAQSQLNALKSQLHPHFLFNTLNTLSTLILKADNTEAERMLSLLNNFLKTTVYESDRPEITLEEELLFITHYLEIEKVRFKDKLEVNEDIDAGTLKASVPSFLLQPIVENAIYHAIAPKKSRGVINIISKKENEKLFISVEDNGPGLSGFNKKKSKEGVGLKITRERLVHLFGKNQQFELGNSALGGLSVKIIIPLIINNSEISNPHAYQAG